MTKSLILLLILTSLSFAKFYPTPIHKPCGDFLVLEEKLELAAMARRINTLPNIWTGRYNDEMFQVAIRFWNLRTYKTEFANTSFRKFLRDCVGLDRRTSRVIARQIPRGFR